MRASRLVERAIAAPGALPTATFRLICAGKAATSMGSAFARLHGSRIREALVVGPAPPGLSTVFESIPGGHPVPTEASERAGRRALALAASVAADETLLVLLSGGASAMMAVPADGITLDDKRRTTDRLLKAGADIHALNTVRKHISAIKGGWLAARASGPSRTFAISDVVGDDLSVIASGPTVADSSTFDDALNVLQRFGGLEAYPASVVARLSAGQRGAVDETPKPHDPRLARAVSTVIGSRRDAMDAAVAEAESRGYHVVRIDEPVVGEARTASIAHLQAMMARAAGVGRPACIVSSGETTVHVTGHGKGGRNQEFALAAAEPLASLGDARGRRQRRHRRHRRPDRRRRRPRRFHHARARPGRRASAIPSVFSPTTTPTPFSLRSAISSTRVPPTRTSGTFKSFFSPFQASGDAAIGTTIDRYISQQMLSRDQILTLMRERVHHPAGMRELLQILKVPRDDRTTFKRHIKSLVSAGDLIQIRGHRFGPAGKNGSARRPAADAPGRLRLRHARTAARTRRRRHLHFPGPISTKRCRATAWWCASSASRTAGAPKGASSAFSSAPTNRSSAATTATRAAWATSCRSTAAC